MVPIALDLYFKVPDGISLEDMLNNPSLKKCSQLSLWFIVKHCPYHNKANKIKLSINVLLTRQKTEEIPTYSLLS